MESGAPIAKRRTKAGMLAALLACAAAGPLAPASAQIGVAGRSPIYLEDSPDASDLIAQASDLVQGSRLAEAAAVYQKLMQDYGRKLVSIDTGGKGAERAALHADIRVEIGRRLAANPALLEAYQRLFDGEAAAQLAQAMTGGAPAEPDAATPAAPAARPAGIRIDIAGVERVYRRYWLCATGLEAGLRLTGLCLARGSVADASALLDALSAHPLLATQSQRYQRLQAAAGLFGGDARRLAAAKQAMADARDAEGLAELAGWEKRARPASIGPALLSPLAGPTTTQPAKDSVPADLSKPLWSIQVADPVNLEAPRMYGLPAMGPIFATLPAVEGDRLIINAGDEVLAVERHSGRRLWRARRSSPSTNSDSANAMRMRSQMAAPTQPRGVALDGGTLTAVVGSSLMMPMNWGGMTFPTATVLMGIDAATGRTLWEVAPADVDETLEQGSFIGTPTMTGGRTYVLLRRAQMQGLQHTVVVALESATGRLLWRRSLASANYLGGALGSASILASGGRLYIGDSLGVTVCVDCGDGAVRWLNTSGSRPLSELAEGRRLGLIRATGVSNLSNNRQPLLLSAGLLVPSGGFDEANLQAVALLLDPDTGKPRDVVPRAALAEPLLNEAEHVIPVGGDLLAVGSSVTRLDGKTLAVKWTRRLDAIKSSKLAGTPAVTGDLVFLPTPDRILGLEVEGGKLAVEREVENPGNLLLLAGQLICINDREARGFLDWKVAYDRLKSQIERDGRSASSLSASLTLAQVALAAGVSEAMIEGADLALANAAAIASGGVGPRGPQREVFASLLALADSDKPIPLATRRALFERVAAAAQSPTDEAAYRLALAQRLAAGKAYADAVDQYQTLLSDSTLASQLIERGSDSRQAGLESRVQLGKLLKESGDGAYEKFNAMAAQRLAELTAPGAPRDASALSDIARQYPFARAVPAALLAAGETLLESGNFPEAILQLRRATLSGDRELAPRAAGALVAAYLGARQPRLALAWLARFKRDNPELPILRAGKPVAPDAWAGELASQARFDDALPALQLPLGTPTAIPGRLVLPAAQNEDAWPLDRLVILKGNTLTLHAGERLAPAWSIQVPEQDAAELVLLSHNRLSCLFYLPVSRTLRLIGAQDGRDLWPARRVEELLAEAGNPADRRKAATPEQQDFMEAVNRDNFVFRNGKILTPRDILLSAGPALFTKSNDQVVCVGDHLGRVVALERATGKVLWKLLCPFDRLEFLEMSGETLALAGQTAFTSENATGNVLILDPLTGETRKSVDDKDPPQWVAVADDGRLLVATATQLLCRLPDTGEVSWRLVLPDRALTNVMRVQGDILLARVATGEILAIDTSSGQIVNRFANTEAAAINDALVLRPAQDNWHVLSSTAATMLDAHGKVRWRDAIRPEEKHFIAQLIGEQLVALVAVTQNPPDSVLLPGYAGPAPSQRARMGGVIRAQRVRVNANAANAPAIGDAEPVAEGATTPATPWTFKLFFLDRLSGKLVAEQALAPMSVPLRPIGSTMINHRLILSTGNAVIVLPDATIRP